MTRMTDQDLARLARRMPEPEPTPEQAAAARDAILARAASTPQRRPAKFGPMTPWAAAAALLLVVGGGAYMLRSITTAAPPPRLASVTASGAATFEHVTQGPGEVEVVRLDEGRIRLDVVPLGPTQRFIVMAGDAEVEVRGTVFEVVVLQHQLRQVQVLSGRVEVRRPGQPVLLLGGGETWSRQMQAPNAADAPEPRASAPAAALEAARTIPEAPRSAPEAARPGLAAASPESKPRGVGSPSPEARGAASPSPEPRSAGSSSPEARGTASPSPEPRSAGSASRSAVGAKKDEAGAKIRRPRPEVAAAAAVARAEDPAEIAFRKGWAHLRAKSPRQAAQAFELASAPGSPVAEDARYWRAVALLRADDSAAAEDAFAGYLAKHPDGVRADEAALLLGRLRTERGDTAGAKVWLQRAARSRNQEIRSRAGTLLERAPDAAGRLR